MSNHLWHHLAESLRFDCVSHDALELLHRQICDASYYIFKQVLLDYAEELHFRQCDA